MEDEMFYVGQKAFIRKENEVLILQNASNNLDFPGGKIQKGETDLIESLKREVREETGFEIEVDKPFVTWSVIHKYKPDRIIYLVGYRCQYKSGELTVSSEHTNYRWVNKDNYTELDQTNPYFKSLEKYFKD